LSWWRVLTYDPNTGVTTCSEGATYSSLPYLTQFMYAATCFTVVYVIGMAFNGGAKVKVGSSNQVVGMLKGT
jgi:hypothetical protein